ncbi:hypothetical protein ASPSYDRAFT_84264 [Aspergillus sydowii CBS 593.65]|uniref:Uncharacterized protein n=1 Tax=Aspergillus sydowii CBS 593.65 TaxID=1036612 RepID=A0A1L9TXR7_9EURO|nr:uncharacterized protein ASPSYDRAFT_84264 [Aspergillus sydowii CBS 593.65]OJJ64244.1 hypothetical protein ASPSYDRAFT_84264 [Aspergillus sydowii CBS 593.65]
MSQPTSGLFDARGSDYELAYASPKLFPTTYDDPAFAQPGILGPDGRRRRALHCISDPDITPVSAGGFINEDLRAGGPYLCKLPMDIEFLRPSHPFYEPLYAPESNVMQRVREILVEWKVAYTDINVMLQTWRFCRERGGVPTISILASRGRDKVDDTWVSCARDIQHYLSAVLPLLQDLGQDQGQGLTQPLPHIIRVEIVAPSALMGDALHPVKPFDEILYSWDELARAIKENINQEGILTVGCDRHGGSDDPCECAQTISVGVLHNSESIWKGIREQMVELLDERELGMVAVRVHKQVLLSWEWQPEDDWHVH